MNGNAVNPGHYREGGVEAYTKIKAMTMGLEAEDAICLANIIKYCDRAGRKEGSELFEDFAKANNCAHMLCNGHWRDE